MDSLIKKVVVAKEINHKGQGLWVSLKVLQGDVKQVCRNWWCVWSVCSNTGESLFFFFSLSKDYCFLSIVIYFNQWIICFGKDVYFPHYLGFMIIVGQGGLCPFGWAQHRYLSEAGVPRCHHARWVIHHFVVIPWYFV